MKKLILILALVLLPLSAQAQLVRQTLFENYDLDATTLTYGVFAETWSTDETKLVNTSGSSTTITAVTAGQKPFNSVAAGDQIQFEFVDTGPAVRLVVSVAADKDSVVVDTAITIATAGKLFKYRKWYSGTVAASGWFGGGYCIDKALAVRVAQMNVTGTVDIQLECDIPGTGSAGINIYTKSYSAAGSDLIVVTEFCERFRLGLKISSADDGSDTGAAQEQISAWWLCRR